MSDRKAGLLVRRNPLLLVILPEKLNTLISGLIGELHDNTAFKNFLVLVSEGVIPDFGYGGFVIRDLFEVLRLRGFVTTGGKGDNRESKHKAIQIVPAQFYA